MTSATKLMGESTAGRLGPVAALLLALAVPPPAVAAASTTAVGDIPVVFDARVVGDRQRVRFVADISAKVEATVFTLADPYRIVVDLPEVRFALPDDAGSSGRGPMSAFRYGLFAQGKSRIVIDLTAPVEVDKSFVTDAGQGQPARLVLDAVPTTREKFLAQARLYRRNQDLAAAQLADRTLAAPTQPMGEHVVVLDPGHGGIDSGAHGRGGTLEKTVTLAFAKVFAAKLKATGRYDVFMTRTDDTFVSLGDRVAFARDHDADLLLSIHANSFYGAAVRGATVYTVSDKASDKMAEEMANSENQSDVLAGVDVKGEDSNEVKDILLDLTRRETRNFGEVFARHLVTDLGRTTRMFKDPHQRASFKVLEAPDVPSALIELGFLSNATDEKLLISPKWQERTADSMLKAVDEFFETQLAGKNGQ